jgi:hypothetical protein
MGLATKGRFYLPHSRRVLFFCYVELTLGIHAGPFGTGAGAYLGLWIVVFLVYYGGSLLLTQVLLRHPQLAWTVGQRAEPPTEARTQVPVHPTILVS